MQGAITIASTFRCEVRLAVELPGHQPYAATVKVNADPNRPPDTGMVLPVVVDRNDAQRIEVDLDGVPSLRDRAAAEQQRVLDAMTGNSVPGPNPNARPEGSEPAPGDQIISDLERLERLHQSGALTDDELEAQKARILRGA